MNPQVRFYVLQEDSLQARHVFACRLAERAWKNGVRTHIALRNQSDITMMDNLLWSFREDSFLPHGRLDQNAQSDIPVTLGLSEELPQGHDGQLINLSDTIPDNLGCFSRIAEIVVQLDEVLTTTRAHYQTYSKRDMHPKSEQIGRAV